MLESSGFSENVIHFCLGETIKCIISLLYRHKIVVIVYKGEYYKK